MRLLCKIEDQKVAQKLSLYLQSIGIENNLEMATKTDWGNVDYGDAVCTVWVYDEENFDLALKTSSEFLEDPQNPKFHISPSSTNFNMAKENPEGSVVSEGQVAPRQPLGVITFYLLLLCSILLFINNFTAPTIKTLPPSFIPLTPLITSPINKALMYDYPQSLEFIDRLVSLYGKEALENLASLPEPGQVILYQFRETPYWQGFYDFFLSYFKGKESTWGLQAPLFEKIREGEVWRLITPAFIHRDILHLVFNMIWLLLLGRQMEYRLGKWRYILFLILVGIFSNTAQYLMSGFNFLGFSGIVCGMLGFIWNRQRLAPWEGYQLEKGTMAFITFFVLFMFFLQVAAFILQITANSNFSIGIANTAHLSGAIAGYYLAHFPLFSWHYKD